MAPAEAARRELPAIYLRRRLLALAGALAFAVAVLLLSLSIGSSVGSPADDRRDRIPFDVSAVVVVVEPGDTLWGIAQRFRPAGDQRAMVDVLAELVGGSVLEVGQEIRIPTHLLS